FPTRRSSDLDLTIGAAARHVAVVAQPAGGGGVAGFDEALCTIERPDPTRSLGQQPGVEAAQGLDPRCNLVDRERLKVDARQRGQTSLQLVKHLFDYTNQQRPASGSLRGLDDLPAPVLAAVGT